MKIIPKSIPRADVSYYILMIIIVPSRCIIGLSLNVRYRQSCFLQHPGGRSYIYTKANYQVLFPISFSGTIVFVVHVDSAVINHFYPCTWTIVQLVFTISRTIKHEL